jgi:hypothetical protein
MKDLNQLTKIMELLILGLNQKNEKLLIEISENCNSMNRLKLFLKELEEEEVLIDE